MDFRDNNSKALYNQLRELLLVFKHILTHFEGLEEQVQVNDFNSYPSITHSITYI
jgi:hypothetical protein